MVFSKYHCSFLKILNILNAVMPSLINTRLGIGGYFHGLRDLSYGVDLDRIRWCGVLQVFVIPPATVVNITCPWTSFLSKREIVKLVEIFCAENSTGLLYSCPLWDMGTAQTSRCFQWQVCDLQNLLPSLVSAVLPTSKCWTSIGAVIAWYETMLWPVDTIVFVSWILSSWYKTLALFCFQ